MVAVSVIGTALYRGLPKKRTPQTKSAHGRDAFDGRKVEAQAAEYLWLAIRWPARFVLWPVQSPGTSVSFGFVLCVPL
jgi:hypothetical protein